MSRKSLNQSGFSAVEGLLIVIIVILIGFVGYYVHHTQQQTDAINNAAAKVAQSSPAKGTIKKVTTTTTPSTSATTTQASTQYFTIKEWGVRASYSGSFHLTYTINNNGGNPPIYAASITASELTGSSYDCSAGGGVIERAYANTVLDSAGTTPTSSSNPYATTKVGSYYYIYYPNQDPESCGTSTASVQEQVEAAAKTIVENLQATPLQ